MRQDLILADVMDAYDEPAAAKQDFDIPNHLAIKQVTVKPTRRETSVFKMILPTPQRKLSFAPTLEALKQLDIVKAQMPNLN